jgi:hypothetical protein
VHLGLDALFIVYYGVLALLLVTSRARGARRWSALACLAGLVIIDIAEDVCAALVVFQGADAPWLGNLSLGKWFAAAALLAALVLGRRGILDRFADLWIGLRHQRFSLIPVVPLAVLSVLSGHSVLEQLPDAQRGWLEHGWHAVASLAATALAASSMFIFGRARTAQAVNTGTNTPDSRRPVHALLWVTAPALLLVAAALPGPNGLGVDWMQLLLFSAVGLVMCLAVNLSKSCSSEGLPGPRSYSPRQVRRMVAVGDALAHAIVVIGGLSLIKSFLNLVVLDPGRGLASACCGFGLVSCLGVWAVPGLVDQIGARYRRVSPTWLASTRWWRRIVAYPGDSMPGWVGPVAALVLGVHYLCWVWVGPWMAKLGMAAIAIAGLMALTVLVSGLGLLLGAYQTATPLRWMGLRSTPVVSMLLAASLFNLFAPTSPDLHRVRVSAAAGPVAAGHRPTLKEAFDTWVAGDGCTTMVGTTVVKPMLLVAAEGGGIRATYWTVHALDALHDGLGCSTGSVFAASGASGGAVGLVVAQTAADPDAVVEQMAGPRPLAAGVAALFGADQLTGTTGVPLSTSGSGTWRDRAGTLEDAWNSGAAADGGPRWGDQPFLRADTQATPTGSLIINSTLVGSGCRVWLSQIRLDGETGGAADGPQTRPAADAPTQRDCGPFEVVAPRTIDLFASFAPATETGATDRCVPNLPAVSAAMLAARFPFVTPTGVLGPCRDQPRSQLVDGGYVENSGLRTWIDLAPDLSQLIRAHNSGSGVGQPPGSAGQAPGSAGHPLVVPIVVYLDNGQSLDLSASTNAVPEPLAPLTAGLAASLDSDSAHVLQLAETFDQRSLCPDPQTGCAAAVTGLGLNRVVVVKECPGLGLEAPLGWTLSRESMNALDHDLQLQAAGTGCPGTDATSRSSPTSTLAQLRTVLAA